MVGELVQVENTTPRASNANAQEVDDIYESDEKAVGG
jgi:hypothetical protein